MSKRVRVHPVAIGAFAAGAVALAIAGLLIFGASKVFARKFPVIMFFEENVSGLVVGAPVSYRGLRLGEVTEIRSLAGTPRIAVAATLERGPLLTREAVARGDQMRPTLEAAISQGLRAQLALQSLLTGQLYVSLVLRPDTPISRSGLDSGQFEIPTIPTIMAQLELGLQQVPLAEMPKHLYETVQGSAKLLQSKDLEKTLASMGPLLADTQTLMRRLNTEVGPLLVSLKGTSDTARASLEDVTKQLDRAVSDLQPEAKRLLVSLSETSDAIRQLKSQTDALLISLTTTSDTTRGAVGDVAGDVRKTLGQLGPQIAALTAKLQEVSDR